MAVVLVKGSFSWPYCIILYFTPTISSSSKYTRDYKPLCRGTLVYRAIHLKVSHKILPRHIYIYMRVWK